jgi:hypothetical protein
MLYLCCEQLWIRDILLRIRISGPYLGQWIRILLLSSLDLQDANKNLFFLSFSAYYFLRFIYSRNQGFVTIVA